MLRRVLAGEAAAEHCCVVVLRGLPGSGKSHVAELLLQHGGEHVSADNFFYEGAGRLTRKKTKGLTRDEIYAQCFSVQLLDEAHAHARRHFQEALDNRRVAVIVVDNCNVRLADMQPYLDMAATAPRAVDVAVVELAAPGQLGVLHARGQHAVPLADLGRMQQRWEKYPDALLLSSLGEAPGVRSGAAAAELGAAPASATLPLGRWLQLHHLYSSGRRATHLVLAFSKRGHSFLDIPDHLLPEFRAVYAAAAGLTGAPPTPCYLTEYCTPLIHMFLDVDYDVAAAALAPEHIAAVARTAQRALQRGDAGRCLVAAYLPASGATERPGLHLHFPDVVVSLQEARALRDACAARLAAEAPALGLPAPRTSWEQVVDGSIYDPKRALRMLGSRKITNKGVDVGRVYTLWGVLDAAGALDANAAAKYAAQPTELLRDASIRVSASSLS